MERQSSGKVGLKEAISIGIGGMVGGGIFAVLGLAVSLAKGGTPVSFFIAGILALITSYSYVKLSIAYPDRGGTVKFINTGFGNNVFSGGINNLLWVSYIVMLSLYASAFGSYAPNLFSIFGDTYDYHIYASTIILLATIINFYSVKFVGMIESYAVIIKLIILLGFIIVGVYGLGSSVYVGQLDVSNWESPISLIAGGMVIFVAYEGFELIANAAPDIDKPLINIPRAYYTSVIFVILLYVVISVVTIGSLPFDEIAAAEDYVLAEAAKPMLGNLGFTIITIAAMISTFSAINASLYGGSRVSFRIAEEDELPHQLTCLLWNQPIGLLITATVTLLLANTLDLESISTAGSIGFILIFALVNLACYKKRDDINASALIPMLGFVACAIAVVILINQQLSSNQVGLLVAGAIIVLCFILEWIYKSFRAG